MWIVDQVKKWINRVNNIPYSDNPTNIRDMDYTKLRNPIIRNTLIECSLNEDAENSYYSGILSTFANHSVGVVPLPVALTSSNRLNDAIEDRWMEWTQYNSIGASLREARRKALQTGLAVIIPYKSKSDYDLKLALQVVGSESLKSPSYKPNENIVDGVEFWPNGEIKGVWVDEDDLEPRYYDVEADKIIVWYKRRPFPMWPECHPAFRVYPSINRYLENAMREAEFRTAVPMALELDATMYRLPTGSLPTGKFKYEPGMIPTLPPGAKLTGLNLASLAQDRGKHIETLASVAARCINMPKTIALLNSSDSNMATAHLDSQPWKNEMDIDRFDYEPVTRRVFKMWYEMVALTTLMPPSALLVDRPMVLFNYTVLFNHPDPQKNATARATDLISGASTLTRIYAEQSKNARREIEKECKLLGISREEFYKLLLVSRAKQIGDLYATEESDTKDEDASELQGTKKAKVSRV